jgi:predicted membrane protein
VSDEKNFDPKKFKDDLRDQIHRGIRDRFQCDDEKQQSRRRPMVVGIALRGRGRGGIITGAFLMLIGLAFLLDHLGIINMGQIWRFWPLLVVFAGAVNLTSRDRQAWGIFLIGAGTLEQLNELGITHIGWSQFWPMMVMALGFFIIWGSFQWSSKAVASASKGGDPRTTLNEAVVFGGLERRMTSPDFQGGDITAIFGGIELDLTEASMQANEATLAITAIFGGVEVRVPPTWQVAFRGAPIFGGIEDKTRTARVDDPASPDLKTLVITGAVIFGGLEIKN